MKGYVVGFLRMSTKCAEICGPCESSRIFLHYRGIHQESGGQYDSSFGYQPAFIVSLPGSYTMNPCTKWPQQQSLRSDMSSTNKIGKTTNNIWFTVMAECQTCKKQKLSLCSIIAPFSNEDHSPTWWKGDYVELFPLVSSIMEEAIICPLYDRHLFQ